MMGAKNKVINGDYEKCDVHGNGIKIGFMKTITFDAKNVRGYEIIDEELRTNASSAIIRGFAGGFVLGPVGLLAALSAKKKGEFLILIEFNDGKKSLIEIDAKLFKSVIKNLGVLPRLSTLVEKENTQETIQETPLTEKDSELLNEVDLLFKSIHIDSKKQDLSVENEQERIFIYSLLVEMKNNKVDRKLKLQRLSDRTINVMLSTREYIGKINVGNSNNFMQVPQNLDVIDTYEGISFEECLSYIPAWVKYINEELLCDIYDGLDEDELY